MRSIRVCGNEEVKPLPTLTLTLSLCGRGNRLLLPKGEKVGMRGVILDTRMCSKNHEAFND